MLRFLGGFSMRFIKSIMPSVLLILCLSFITQCMLFGSQEVDAAVKKNIALCFDLDDVISGKEKIGFTDYLGLVPKLLFKHPKIVTAALPKNLSKIREQADEISKTTNGTSNIMHDLIGVFKEEGYGDLSAFECEFVQRSLSPFLVKRMINNIKKLKAQGYTVLGATNQDWKQHKVYRKKMKALGVDLNTLFEVVLTTRVNHVAAPAGDQLSFRLNESENIYVVRDEKGFKPSVHYFKALEQLAKQRVPNATRIIHTDDTLENIIGARAAGLRAFHFKLAGLTARKTSKNDLKKTIDVWQAELAQHGIRIE